MLPKNNSLLLGGEMRPEISKGLLWILGELGERGSELLGNLKSLVQHHVIDGQGKERVGLAAEVGDAVFDRSVHNGAGVEFVGDRFLVAFEEVLVDAVVFVEQLQGRFEALRETVNRGIVETLVIDAAYFEDDAHLAAFCEKDVRPDEAVEIDLLAQRAGLVIVFEDSAKPEHGHPFGSQLE